MAEYNPFSRGPYPVGVKTYEIMDSTRQRKLPVECWYPSTDAYRGKDLDRNTQDSYLLMPSFPKMRQAAVRDAEIAPDLCPLVIFSHGLAGHRRQTTHFCTHLASHGYIVASADHVGNTMPDLMNMAMQSPKGGNAPNFAKTLMDSATARPLDVSFTIDMMLAGEMGARIAPDRIGICGHSFGGWTALAATGRDRRIKAALPLAPAGGKTIINPMSNFFSKLLSLDWDRPVPTLYLVADLDSLLPIDGMRDLFSRTHQPKKMVILKNADHFHFCDGVEATHDLFRKMGGLSPFIAPGGEGGPESMKNSKPSSELLPGRKAYTFLQGLGLAHMDGHLKNNPDALEFLKGDIKSLLAGKNIEVETEPIGL